MPIVTQCEAPGCETLTMGPYCIEHDELPAYLRASGQKWMRDTVRRGLASGAVARDHLPPAHRLRRAARAG
jgi:hypothetical protein